MSDLREFTAPPSEESGGRTSKILAGAAVALMIGAAGAYVYATSGQPQQPQKVALNEPAPLAPPPAPVATTPADTAMPAPADVAPPAAIDKQPVKTTPSSSSTPRVQHEAHIKARSIRPETAPAVTPPDTTQVPDVPATTTMTPQAAPAPAEPTPDVTPQTTAPNDQTQTPNATPQTPQ